MSPFGKWLVTVILLVAGTATLAFTACGLFFGVGGFVQPGGLGVALMGLTCAAIGIGLMFALFKAWRSVWSTPSPADSPSQKPPASSEDGR